MPWFAIRRTRCPAASWVASGIASTHHGFQAWCETWATEALRVLKPEAISSPSVEPGTSHRLVCAIEDAGFEIRDSLMWLYGSGFPKSAGSIAIQGRRERRTCAYWREHRRRATAASPISPAAAAHGTSFRSQFRALLYNPR